MKRSSSAFLAMRLERRRAIGPSQRSDLPEVAYRRGLPVEIAFLAGKVDPAILAAAAFAARRSRVCAAQALIAEGQISASFYYRALARRLGVAFDKTWPILAPDIDVHAALRSGRVRVASEEGPRWISAPEGRELQALLSGRLSCRDRMQVALTTPAHLRALIQYRAQPSIETIATHELSRTAPRLSAKGAADTRAMCALFIAALCASVVYTGVLGEVAPRIVGGLFGLLFLSGMTLRLLAAAAAFAGADDTVVPLSEAELPRYTVLVPLAHESEVLPDLLAALSAIDYPRAKLEVLILIEPEDRLTRNALAAADLPPWIQVAFAPQVADLRTKPRALNIGLILATGELLTVYDAEDRPDPDQLRLAAATFRSKPDLACLQARIAIDNGDNGFIARLFAIEYAALFDILNVGIAYFRWPLALGGTSNHFRTACLRAAGGWDPWNVTEDADLGLRLSRLGYRVGCLASTTFEAAPESLAIWMKQRRRWMKGWLQTVLVLAHDTPNIARELGASRSIVLMLLIVNMSLGPLFLPPFLCLTGYQLATYGLPSPSNLLGIGEATLALSVPILGFALTLGSAVAGMKQRGLTKFLPSLPLLFLYQLMISVAAFMGLLDLVRRPYHWHKTPHGRHTRQVGA